MRFLFIPVFALFCHFALAQQWVQVGNINRAIDHLYADTLNGSLYVGGSFRYFNGIETRGIFQLDSLGAVHTLGSGQDGCGPYNCYPVKVITRYKNEIYIGWVPTTIGGGVVVYPPESGLRKADIF